MSVRQLVAIGYNGPGTGSDTSAQAAQAQALASQLAAWWAGRKLASQKA
jgi:hypothetical protein